MKKFTKFEIFELITILILFVALITNNNVIKEDNITYELSNKGKNYVAKYIDNEITNCNLSEIYDNLTDATSSSNIFLSMYPVGSIYTSINNTNPGTIFGGTWIEFGSGRTLVGVDTNDNDFRQVEKTGGDKIHQHEYGLQYGGWWGQTAIENATNVGLLNYSASNEISLTGRGQNYSTEAYQVNNALATSLKSISDGVLYRMIANTSSTSTLQPYITVYMWKRTA